MNVGMFGFKFELSMNLNLVVPRIGTFFPEGDGVNVVFLLSMLPSGELAGSHVHKHSLGQACRAQCSKKMQLQDSGH